MEIQWGGRRYAGRYRRDGDSLLLESDYGARRSVLRESDPHRQAQEMLQAVLAERDSGWG